MVTTFTYKPSLVKIDAHNLELSWSQTHKQTNTQTHKHTNRQGRLQYTAPQLSRSVIKLQHNDTDKDTPVRRSLS